MPSESLEIQAIRLTNLSLQVFEGCCYCDKFCDDCSDGGLFSFGYGFDEEEEELEV